MTCIFQKKKKPKHIKPTYLSNYILNVKQNIKILEDAIIQKKNDQIRAKMACL